MLISKKYKEVSKIRWDNITTIKSESNNRFEIHTNNATYIFESPTAISILIKIVENIMTVIPSVELPYFVFSKSYLDQIQLTKDAMAKRVKFVSYINNRKVPDELYEKLKMTAFNAIKGFGNKKTLNIDEFNDFDYFLDLILDSLNVFPLITRLLITKPMVQKQSYWEILSEFVKKNQTIQTLESFEPITPQFKKFCENFINSPNSKIQQLGFYNNSYGSDFVYLLNNVLNHKQIRGISISNGLNFQGYQMIVPYLKNGNGFNNLHSLSISETKFVQFEDIISSLPTLKLLYLTNCSLDLSDVFSILSKYTGIGLLDLRLSGNSFLSPINQKIVLPEHLENLYLDNVEFKNNSLKKLFMAIEENYYENGYNTGFFTLSIKNATQSPSQWETLENYLYSFECKSIIKLYYDCNPIQKGFAEFLKNAKNLSFLSLKACLFEDAPFLFDFANALSINQSICSLSIRGEKNHKLKKSFRTILNGLKENCSIKLLDISNNNIGDDLTSYLLELFDMNKNVTEIFLDDNNYKDIQNLINGMKENGDKVKIHLPRNDLNKNLKDKLLTTSEVNSIKVDLNSLESQKSEIALSTNQFRTRRKSRLTDESVFSFSEPGSMNISLPFISYHMGSPGITKSNNDLLNEYFPFGEDLLEQVSENIISEVKQINKQYISDEQWESLYDRIPKINSNSILKEYELQFSITNLLKEIE